MGNPQLYKRKRANKRKFTGNQYTKIAGKVSKSSLENKEDPNDISQPSDAVSATFVETDLLAETNQNDSGGSCSKFDASSSGKKLKKSVLSTKVYNENCNSATFNFIMNSSLLYKVIEVVGRCPECSSSISTRHEKKIGLSNLFLLKCCDCTWKYPFYSSMKYNPKKTAKRGGTSFDINTRSIIAFRKIGVGHAGIVTFSSIMNMQPPMNTNAYNKTVINLHQAYSECAAESMQNAAAEIPLNKDNISSDNFNHVVASLDGTWQRRGYSSLNGVVTAISNGKCVDYDVCSKVCKACEQWTSRMDDPGYQKWKDDHDCPINHYGSAGSMEAASAVRIFKRSTAFNKLRYISYLGDGDSKSYSEVVKSNPYPGIAINKLECVGHVQKRVGSRLRTLRTNYKDVEFDDGKGIRGNGRLTDKVINSLQNFYGICIRQKYDTIYQKQVAIAAIIHHCTNYANAEFRHQFCPRDKETTWCKYHKLEDKSTYKPTINIPAVIADIIRDSFSYKDLASTTLLEKCLHGQTQNVNEALNQLIWKRCPKTTFAGKQTVDIAVASAVLQFNDGKQGLLNVLTKLNLERGYYVSKAFLKEMNNRINTANKKGSTIFKQRRKTISSNKKGFTDKLKEKEGVVYKTGAF